MFAGEFVAGASAGACDVAQVNTGFVWFLAAAFAFAPEQRVVSAEAGPVARVGQRLARFKRGRIWREGFDLFGAEFGHGLILHEEKGFSTKGKKTRRKIFFSCPSWIVF
jgi:hypothetical protein